MDRGGKDNGLLPLKDQTKPLKYLILHRLTNEGYLSQPFPFTPQSQVHSHKQQRVVHMLPIQE